MSMLTAYVVWHLGVRPLLLDIYKARIFKLRSLLFDFAMDGDYTIRFDDDEYGFVRERLNSRIRYAHRMSFIDLLVTRLTIKDFDEMAEMCASEREQALESASSDDARRVVEVIEDKADEISVLYLAAVTPLSWILVIPVVLTHLARFVGENLEAIWRSLELWRKVGQTLISMGGAMALNVPLIDDRELAGIDLRDDPYSALLDPKIA